MRAANSNENQILTTWKDAERLDVLVPAMTGPIPGPELLSSLRDLQTQHREAPQESPKWLAYHVEASPDCGGGLDYMANAISNGSREEFKHHVENYVDMMLDNIAGHDADVVTVAVINGTAQGASVCLALSCDFVIATKNSTFSFPNEKEGLPAAAGIHAMLSRRVGSDVANEIIHGERPIRVETLHDLGIVANLSEPDEDDPAGELIQRNRARHESLSRARKSLNRACPFQRDDIRREIDAWIEAAFKLSPAHIGSIRRNRIDKADVVRHG